MKKSVEKLFAVTAPGLEDVCARELVALEMDEVAAVPGGVEFNGTLREVYRANLWLRTASRIVVRVGSFKTRDFPDLYRKTVRLPWGKFIRPGNPLQVRAVSHRSRLNHTRRISTTVTEAIQHALGQVGCLQGGAEQLVFARFEDDRCVLSVDSSGDLLHRRGYRKKGVPAPLRETLAAGILLLLGWDGSASLIDPMCGSGTFVIEGALLAQNRPPGRHRLFAFMDWPGYRPGLWNALLVEADQQKRNVAVLLQGSDRDEVAVAAARQNAELAGVSALVGFEQKELQHVCRPSSPGLILCNPPYGERLEKKEDLQAVFRQLGKVYKDTFSGWRRAFLCPDEYLARSTGLGLKKRAVLSNGGIPVGLFEVL